MNEQESLVALNMVSGLGPTKINRLVSHFGSAGKSLQAARSKLEQVEGIGEAIAGEILSLQDGKAVGEEISQIKNNRVSILFFKDSGYPELLKNIYDPPPVLYVKGSFLESDAKSVALVGSRASSLYGKNNAKKLGKDLAIHGFTVISGLARGIDSQAHEGALEQNGRTVAVLGNGLKTIYPPENKDLAEKIEQHGCLVTEFPMSMKPLPQNFPRRNRIISGLSLGTVVVEATLSSGALITANWALEQGREVFAVPGYIGVKNTEGPHQLLKSGAKLVENVNDILEEFGAIIGQGQRNSREPFVVPSSGSLSEEEKKLFDVFEQERHTLHIDEIYRLTGLPIQQLSSILMMLEIKGYIKQAGGKNFSRYEN